MKQLTKPILLNNLNLKIYSVILGYSLWSIVAPYFTIERTYTVPICFYPHIDSISYAPETLQITLRGTRKHMATINPETLAAHIATDNLSTGKHKIKVSRDMLFLPETISVVNYLPSHDHITVQTS